MFKLPTLNPPHPSLINLETPKRQPQNSPGGFSLFAITRAEVSKEAKTVSFPAPPSNLPKPVLPSKSSAIMEPIDEEKENSLAFVNENSKSKSR